MKVLNWIIALCGLWELGDIVLPFVIGSGNVLAFVWNHIITGMLLVLAGALAARTGNLRTARTLDWISAVAGVWLMIAPFLLGPPRLPQGCGTISSSAVSSWSSAPGLLLHPRG